MERARSGGVYFGLLDRATQRRLKQQLMAPAWDLDSQGRRKVEAKEKIGRSPDDADAANLAFYEAPAPEYGAHEPLPRQEQDRDRDRSQRRVCDHFGYR